ncbi:MAG: dTDP-4-dehydrorhamnose 3,5-epimerase [Bdellovibrionaceae bacterium]|nr:dTDP-4-dehydrorhamnose 3,5-epimerase [Pseudobdellovibrionaceae bacterium]MDW8191151.1 dTDP-4-dehydrorhamnose 3,5-epimerase [Pseudobdellovibrionaceae bacterium]
MRGLHYQQPNPQGKLVRVLTGKIFDVVVDLRKTSPTFLEWRGIELEAGRFQALWIPPGFAHGFYVLEDALVIYKTTSYYDPSSEHTIKWDDPQLLIQWPLMGSLPSLSLKDQKGLRVSEVPYF